MNPSQVSSIIMFALIHSWFFIPVYYKKTLLIGW
jgi:hypothetical protein